MPQHQGLVLTAKGDVKVAKVTSQAATLQLADIQKYLKKKTGIVLLGKYSMKGTTLFLFGSKEGKAGTENKHELPPPLDSELFFGDILLMASKNSNSYQTPIPFTSQEYENFYTKMFEGFEDLDSEQSGDEDEDEEEEEFEEEELELNEDFIDDADDGVQEEEEEEVEEEVEDEEKEEKEIVDDEEEAPIKNKVIAKEKKPEKKPVKKATKASSQILSQLPDLVNEPELEFESSVNLQIPTHPIRKRVFQLIDQLLNKYLSKDDFILLEHYLFNASLQLAEKRHIKKCWSHPVFEEIYKSHCRSVLLNFNPEQYTGNKTLMERYKEGKVTLPEIAQMTYNDLYPEIWKDLSFRQFEREKRQLEGNKSMATDQFRCHRCGKKECTYYELQTRSADEPMTVFIQCVNCGKHWRQ